MSPVVALLHSNSSLGGIMHRNVTLTVFLMYRSVAQLCCYASYLSVVNAVYAK